jgi:serine phosphatase RsbU (regulator of sigma subunit)
MRTADESVTRKITIGDLVVAVTDAAVEVSKNERKAFRIADLALRRILSVSSPENFERTRNTGGPTRYH